VGAPQNPHGGRLNLKPFCEHTVWTANRWSGVYNIFYYTPLKQHWQPKDNCQVSIVIATSLQLISKSRIKANRFIGLINTLDHFYLNDLFHKHKKKGATNSTLLKPIFQLSYYFSVSGFFFFRYVLS